jgi:hypothetical protein
MISYLLLSRLVQFHSARRPHMRQYAKKTCAVTVAQSVSEDTSWA